jgi:hypothetical protein
MPRSTAPAARELRRSRGADVGPAPSTAAIRLSGHCVVAVAWRDGRQAGANASPRHRADHCATEVRSVLIGERHLPAIGLSGHPRWARPTTSVANSNRRRIAGVNSSSVLPYFRLVAIVKVTARSAAGTGEARGAQYADGEEVDRGTRLCTVYGETRYGDTDRPVAASAAMVWSARCFGRRRDPLAVPCSRPTRGSAHDDSGAIEGRWARTRHHRRATRSRAELKTAGLSDVHIPVRTSGRPCGRRECASSVPLVQERE